MIYNKLAVLPGLPVHKIQTVVKDSMTNHDYNNTRRWRGNNCNIEYKARENYTTITKEKEEHVQLKQKR